MKTDEEIIAAIRALCSEQYLAVLCTQYDGQPFASLVAFAVSNDCRYLCFPTNRDTRKYRNLDADPRVALLIDSRHAYPDDLHAASALTVSGCVVVPDDAKLASLQSIFLARHPQLREFIATPTTNLVVVGVAQYDLVCDFQQIHTLIM